MTVFPLTQLWSASTGTILLRPSWMLVHTTRTASLQSRGILGHFSLQLLLLCSWCWCMCINCFSVLSATTASAIASLRLPGAPPFFSLTRTGQELICSFMKSSYFGIGRQLRQEKSKTQECGSKGIRPCFSSMWLKNMCTGKQLYPKQSRIFMSNHFWIWGSFLVLITCTGFPFCILSNNSYDNLPPFPEMTM